MNKQKKTTKTTPDNSLKYTTLLLLMVALLFVVSGSAASWAIVGLLLSLLLACLGGVLFVRYAAMIEQRQSKKRKIPLSYTAVSVVSVIALASPLWSYVIAQNNIWASTVMSSQEEFRNAAANCAIESVHAEKNNASRKSKDSDSYIIVSYQKDGTQLGWLYYSMAREKNLKDIFEDSKGNCSQYSDEDIWNIKNISNYMI